MRRTRPSPKLAQVYHKKPDDFPETKRVLENEAGGPEEHVNFVHSTDIILYVLASSHVLKSR